MMAARLVNQDPFVVVVVVVVVIIIIIVAVPVAVIVRITISVLFDIAVVELAELTENAAATGDRRASDPCCVRRPGFGRRAAVAAS